MTDVEPDELDSVECRKAAGERRQRERRRGAGQRIAGWDAPSLRYPITQVSLVVHDIDTLLDRDHRLFGWAPWQDSTTSLRCTATRCTTANRSSTRLRGAEVYVGSLNFELLCPIPGGTSRSDDHIAGRARGSAPSPRCSMNVLRAIA